MNWEIRQGDALERLREMADESVHCVVTSPPYYGLRDYGVAGQIGLEKSPEEYIARMVEVFREVRRVLRGDGTLWMNMGDSYASSEGKRKVGDKVGDKQSTNGGSMGVPSRGGNGFKPKDLMGMPWRLALAMQADGWYLRCDIIWHKPSPMPESVTDRPTKAHEYIFLMSKSQNYYYDAEAIKEPVAGGAHARGNGVNPKAKVPTGWDTGKGGHTALTGRYKNKQNESFSGAVAELVTSRNKRSVWTVASEGFSDVHFATFPPKLIEPCILAGCPEGGLVLDPFSGAGTTVMTALRLGRNGVGIELSEEYCEMSRRRIVDDAPLFNSLTTN